MTRQTSRGYEVIDFARDLLGEPLLAWQEEAVIRGLELDRSGGYRYRTILIIAARQNGKSHLSKVLALWRLYVDGARLVLGAAQDLSIAAEVLKAVNETIDQVPELAAEKLIYRQGNGKEALELTTGGRYLIKASTRQAARGLSVDHLTMDEIREQRSWDAWSALSKTITARVHGQIWAISNAGDDQSVVLNALRDAALAGTDPSLCLLEWSAPENCALDDREAWAAANPALGVTISEQAIASSLATDPPAVFRTEVLSQRVDSLDGAIDSGAWKACEDTSMTLDLATERPILCADVAPDGAHVSLVAAVEKDGVMRVGVVQAWSSTEEARRELPALRDELSPQAGAWLPNGPAAALAPLFRAWGWVEVKGAQVPEACQGFADLVRARRVIHNGDKLLTAHVIGASKLYSGDGWRFTRNGAGHCDAAYSAAGAVHTALTLPVEAPLPRPMVV